MSVCLSTGGGSASQPARGVSPAGGGGVSQPGGESVQLGGGVSRGGGSAKIGQQNEYYYTAGGIPLAFTQEDFLVCIVLMPNY